MRCWKMNKKLLANSKALDRLEHQTEREIIKVYQEALKEVRAILGEAYAKYDMEMYEMQKYQRLERLQAQIESVIADVSNKNTTTIKDHISKTYQEAYYRNAYYTESELQIDLAFTFVKPEIIQKVLDNKMTGINWAERMGRNRDETVFQIKQEIAKGLINGESYRKMSRRLKNELDIDANKSLTIARTEGGRARSEATQDSMEEAVEKGVVMKKRWLSTVDERTRTSHRYLDGEVVDIDEKFSNGLLMPRDPTGSASEVINCRCEHIAEIEGFEPTERRIRGEGIVDYVTYKQWAEAKGIPM